MSTDVKRSGFKTFMNTTPEAAATYSLMGDGITTAKIAYNPKTTEAHYIHEDSGTTNIDSYSPNFPVEAEAKKGDEVFDFVDGLRKARAVGSAAQTDIVNVWLYETPVGGAYPAEKQVVTIQFEDFGGDGGAITKFNYTVNYKGDPILGTFNPTTLAFVEAP